MDAFASVPALEDRTVSVVSSGTGTRRRKPVRLPAADASEMLLIRIAPGDTGLIRYLLEGGGGHLCMLTVLDPAKALFKLLFSPHQREEVAALLESMSRTVSLEIESWPFSDAGQRFRFVRPGDMPAASDTERP